MINLNLGNKCLKKILNYFTCYWCMCTCVCARACTRVCAHVHVHMCAHMPVLVCACACACDMLQHLCGGQRTILGNQFFPFSMGLELNSECQLCVGSTSSCPDLSSAQRGILNSHFVQLSIFCHFSTSSAYKSFSHTKSLKYIL